MTFMAQVIS